MKGFCEAVESVYELIFQRKVMKKQEVPQVMDYYIFTA